MIISLWFVWVSFHCESKMDKQDLQAGGSLWYNSDLPTTAKSKKKTKTKLRYVSRNMVFKLDLGSKLD